jgi:hypothetical protein
MDKPCAFEAFRAEPARSVPPGNQNKESKIVRLAQRREQIEHGRPHRQVKAGGRLVQHALPI